MELSKYQTRHALGYGMPSLLGFGLQKFMSFLTALLFSHK